MENTSDVLLSIRNVTKEYYGVPVLKNVSFDIHKGEIHGLVGENGAGKSTLIKIISGAVPATSGQVFFDGQELALAQPKDAIDRGIGVVYQEFNLFPNLAVYENIFFGIEIKNKSGLLDRPAMIHKSQELIHQLGFEFDVTQPIHSLTTAYQQIVEIAKCINHDVRLMIMDEPSASLTDNEVDDMFKVIRKLNARGITFIYISHKLSEIESITDHVTVLRDGNYISTMETKDTSENILIRQMVGRDIEDIYPEKEYPGDTEIIMEVRHMKGPKTHDVSFALHKGEVLGFGGLVGAGRTELMRLIFGADPKISGEVYLQGEKIEINAPSDAVAHGIGLIPEDRKQDGLVLNKSIFLNCLLPSMKDYLKKPLNTIDFKHARTDIQKVFSQLAIKASGLDQKVQNLSGGNQQKVVLEKWILKDCKVLILDEPTRGIDVGAKQEIYRLIKELARQGKAIIVVSSEMPELIGVSHRILVMHEGNLSGELTGENITQESIMTLASQEN